MRKSNNVLFIIVVLLYVRVNGDSNSNKKRSWREKDIRDMTDAELENIFDQWEEKEDPLEEDELPEHLRQSPKIDLSKLDLSNPDNVLRVTKKGKSLMMFVDVRSDIPEERAEVLMKIWQSSLQNNHIIADRYPIDTRRSVFMFREGSQAIDAKQYLLAQPELSHITLEGQTYYRDENSEVRKSTEGNKSRKGNVVKSSKKMEL